MLKKSAKKFDDTVESLLVKCPEYAREKENEERGVGNETTVIERRNVTLVNNEQVNEMSRRSRSSLNTSDLMIDDRFKKITKKRNFNFLASSKI